MRNPFSKTALRDILLRLSRPSRTILLDELSRLRADLARLGQEVGGARAESAAQHRATSETLGKTLAQDIRALHQKTEALAATVAALQQAETAAHSAAQSRFTALDTTLRQQGEQLAPHLPRRRYESFDVSHFARLHAAQTSAALYSQHLYAKPVFATAEDLIAHCLGLLDGKAQLPLEFGVYSGRTVNAIADALGPDTPVYGFDSFEGLPETWRAEFREGHFARATLPEVRPSVHLVKGWFNDTLPGFRDSVMGQRQTNFIHIDCDLYSSTRTILTELAGHIAEDAILIFDEFFNYPGWEQHEYRAFMEYIESSGRGFDYIGSVPIHQQVAVRLRPATA